MKDLQGQEAAAYVRVSDDKAAGSVLEGTSGEGQEDEAYEVAEAFSLKLPEDRIFNDNDSGASKFSRKVKRDEWDKLIRCIEAKAIGVLIMWECSRGSRRHLEWANFLDLIERQHVLVYAINKGRALDPRDPGDWEILAQEGVKATSEANQISTRVRRGVRKARRKGRPLGMPPFGWTSQYDEKTGKMITWVPVDEQIAVVRELYARMVAGEGLFSLTRDLNRRAELPEGDPERVPWSKLGGRWHTKSVGSLLLTPTHIGKFWGTDDEDRPCLVDGGWEGAVDEDAWWSVRSILTAPERKSSRPGKNRYLLTTIARCVCGSIMGVGFSGSGTRTLRCKGIYPDWTPMPAKRANGGPQQRHATIKMEWADDYVRDEMIDRLCEPEAVRDLTADSGEDQAEAKAKAAAIRADIAAYKELAQARAVSPRDFADYKAQWEPEAERLEEAASAGLHAGAVVALALLREAEDAGVFGGELRAVLRLAWDKLPRTGQREMIRCMTKSITILPGRHGAKVFDPARIAIE